MNASQSWTGHDLGNVRACIRRRLHRRLFYVNWVEQPARLELEDEALLSEWGPSDSRGIALLGAYALLAAIAGFIAYFESQDVRWAFGALVMILSWPYVFFVMTPLDNQIRGCAALTLPRRGRSFASGASSNPA